MSSLEYVDYVGRMKLPLQKPNVDNPSMFMVSDGLKHELSLILLTPGTFSHAYNFIKKFGSRSVTLFFPSLRPEFISDVMNLYMTLKDKLPIKWVFPERYDHYSFSFGHIKEGVHFNPSNSSLSIEYIKNPRVGRVYDFIVRSTDGTHYFSMYITEQKFKELHYCRDFTHIHLPKSETLYGGMTYDSILEMNRKFKKKMVPHDFTSIEEYYLYMGRDIPDIDDEDECDCECPTCGVNLGPDTELATDDDVVKMVEDVDKEENDL